VHGARSGDRLAWPLACEPVAGNDDDAPFEDTGGWNVDDQDEVVVGKRRMRAKRRRPSRRAVVWIVVVVLVLGGAAFGAYRWFNRPTGLAATPVPAVVAPGGFRASIGAANTITVGLEVRNITDVPLTLIDARVVPPPGLTELEVTIAPPGEGNVGFTLDGPLPAIEPVRLGTDGADRNAVVAARFSVRCDALPTPDAPTGEQIFVTIRIGDERRDEELTPPVVDDVPWLTATALRVCSDPVPTESPEPPLPPLTEGPTSPPARAPR
jgi:hypothetical protein